MSPSMRRVLLLSAVVAVFGGSAAVYVLTHDREKPDPLNAREKPVADVVQA